MERSWCRMRPARTRIGTGLLPIIRVVTVAALGRNWLPFRTASAMAPGTMHRQSSPTAGSPSRAASTIWAVLNRRLPRGRSIYLGAAHTSPGGLDLDRGRPERRPPERPMDDFKLANEATGAVQ